MCVKFYSKRKEHVMSNKLNSCLCELADLLGPGKSQVISLLDALIGLLQTLKATIMLFNINIVDEIEKIKYKAELAVIQTKISTISAPFAILLGYCQTLADCDPVASFAKTLRDTRNDLLSDAEEREFEINQLIAELNSRSRRIEKIDRRIQMLTDIRDGLEICE